MVRKPETIFRERFDRLLKLIPNSWFESIQQKTIRGTPDKLGCINGKFVALEFKKSKKDKLMQMQTYKKDRIKAAKGIHFTPCPENMDEILTELNKLAKKT